MPDKAAPTQTTASSQSLGASFRCAFRGVGTAFATQRNMRIHGCFAVYALILCGVLQVDIAGWLAVIVCIALVFSLECVNTALEKTVDLATQERCPLARDAKDCAAGAVVIAAAASLVVAALVYLPAFIRLFA